MLPQLEVRRPLVEIELISILHNKMSAPKMNAAKNKLGVAYTVIGVSWRNLTTL